MNTTSTKIEILDIAEGLIQKRGYNGFSYADISQAIGISKASIHHHFASKEVLVIAVVRRYRELFLKNLQEINNKTHHHFDKIRQYAKQYEAVLHKDNLCLCGMLASDVATLPRALKKEIHHFFNDNVEWLVSILSSIYSSLSQKRLRDLAWQIISSLQGATIMARMLDDRTLFEKTTHELFLLLEKIDS